MGCPSALSAEIWGFQDVLFRGREVTLGRPLGTFVMENVLFKISYPAEFHAQTAIEAAVQLHSKVSDRLDDVERIEIETQEAGLRIIDKTGPLANPADRDHCLQYMVAVALLKGNLTAADYEDEAAADPRIDALREKMQVRENERFSRDYLDPDKRSIANAVRVGFRDRAPSERVEVEYPIGHRRRRTEGMPLLRAKFEHAISTRLAPHASERILRLFEQPGRLDETPVHEFVDLWIA
jgi:2-methylcitrate dehydratase